MPQLMSERVPTFSQQIRRQQQDVIISAPSTGEKTCASLNATPLNDDFPTYRVGNFKTILQAAEVR